MPSLHATLIGLLAASAPVLADKLRVVFSSGNFATVSGTTGNESGSHNGFAIINDDDVAIYDNAYPNDYAPCFTDTRTFTIEGDCWATPRTFLCTAAFDGSPESCEVRDGNGNSLGTGKGETDTTFIGIAIAQDSTCVVEFDSDDSGIACPEDDGNGPLHVTSQSRG